MKIVHVIGTCAPGGAECFVRTLLLEMKRQGVNVALWVMTRVEQVTPNDEIAINFERQFIAQLANEGIPVEFVGKRPRKDWLLTSRELRRLYEIHTPQVIHAHIETVSFHVARSLLFKNCKLVQTIHSTRINHPHVMRYFHARVYDRFVAISEEVKRIAINSHVSAGKVTRIFNGINLNLFNKHGRRVNSIVNSIIAIGRLTKAKNHANLIDAICQVKERFVHGNSFSKTYIVGEGELRIDLQDNIVKRGLGNDVHLLGVRSDIPDLLETNDIYVMSSDWEGLSISLIEAMASGIPVVATDAGSNSEIVDHEVNGLIVPISDPTALAFAIQRMVEDVGLRIRFSISGPEKAKMFAIEHCASKHIEMYSYLDSRVRPASAAHVI